MEEMTVTFADRYETITKKLSSVKLVEEIRNKYHYDFSILSFRMELNKGVKEFFGDNVTIRIK